MLTSSQAMSITQQKGHSVRVVPAECASFDKNGRLVLDVPEDNYIRHTRAVQTVPRMDLITAVIALDCEFQKVYVEAFGKHEHRVGRVSIVNHRGETIYDVFAWYPEEPGKTKKLSPKSLRLGVYWPDIKLRNGAVPIKDVEYYVREILCQAQIVVGHSIRNDIRVFSDGLWDGIKTRDTQLFEPYRAYAKGNQRLPKLSVLAFVILGWRIQGPEHSSVEDAQATMALYRQAEDEIERAQNGGVEWRAAFDERYAEAVHDADESSYSEEDKTLEEEPDASELNMPMSVNPSTTPGDSLRTSPQMSLPSSTNFWLNRVGSIKQNLIQSNPTPKSTQKPAQYISDHPCNTNIAISKDTPSEVQDDAVECPGSEPMDKVKTETVNSSLTYTVSAPDSGSTHPTSPSSHFSAEGDQTREVLHQTAALLSLGAPNNSNSTPTAVGPNETDSASINQTCGPAQVPKPLWSQIMRGNSKVGTQTSPSPSASPAPGSARSKLTLRKKK